MSYTPSSVVSGPWLPVGWPLCSQLQNRAASGQSTALTGLLSK
jgi:hypothetical protein